MAAVLGSFGPSASGQVVINLVRKLQDMEGDSNFGEQARQFNLKTADNFVYSNDPRNGPELVGIPLYPDGGSLVATALQDVLTSTAGCDNFRAVVIGTPTATFPSTTLNPEDIFNGGPGTDAPYVGLTGNYAGVAEPLSLAANDGVFA